MDHSKHRAQIEQLAQETRQPIQSVAPLYEAVWSRLQSQARIEQYLPILVSKHVKRMLEAASRSIH